ncbi:MAG: hypothetical protein IT269_02240 [Saprospiraceae bacterium]|nr:hypothetical protein [Saprospiraceae bacterium]
MPDSEDIQRYLDGDMSAAESADFEQTMAADSDLARQVALRQKIGPSLRDKEAYAFHQALQAVAIAEARKAKKRKIIWIIVLGLAFAAITTGLLLFFLHRQTATSDPLKSQPVPAAQVPDSLPHGESDKAANMMDRIQPLNHKKTAQSVNKNLDSLIASYYQEELAYSVGAGTYMAEGAPVVELTALEKAFGQKQYAEVLTLMRQITPDHQQYNMANWIAAHAAFLLNDCTLAIKYAKRASRLKSSITHAEKAEYLLLLALIKCNQDTSVEFRTLQGKCLTNRFHPAHHFAKVYSQSTKPAQ